MSHDDVGPAIGLACYQRDARHGGFGECIDELGSMTDDPAVLLLDSGTEPRRIDEGRRGILNASQKRTKRVPLTDDAISRVPARLDG